MSDMQRTQADPVMRRLMLLLALLIFLGVVGTAAAVIGAQATRAASRGDVLRTTALVAQIGAVQAASTEDRDEHRLRNEAIHADLCRLIFDITQASPTLREQGIRPCTPPLPVNGAGEVVDAPR